MNGDWVDDDQQLLDVLENALRTGNTVPDWFITAGKASFAWHGIDVELAQLARDSALSSAFVDARAEQAEVRALTFASRELTIEVEITRDTLRGQLVPPQPGELELELRDGRHRATADEFGFFTFATTPVTSFRLHCRTAADRVISTNWVSL